MNDSKNNEIRHEKISKQNSDNVSKNANISQNYEKSDKNIQKQVNNGEKPTNSTTNQNHQQSIINSNKTEPKLPTSKDAKKHKIISALIFIGVTIAVGVIATLLGGKMRDGLEKPPAYPPDIVFTIAWAVLYVAIAIGAFLAFKSVEENKKRRDDVIWYAIHLFFNFMWPLFYFRLNLQIFSAIWLVLTIITAIIVTYRYYRANLISGIIFTVYTLWLIYALYLNVGIAMLNC